MAPRRGTHVWCRSLRIISEPKYVFGRFVNVAGDETGLQRSRGECERSNKEGKKVPGETDGCFWAARGRAFSRSGAPRGNHGRPSWCPKQIVGPIWEKVGCQGSPGFLETSLFDGILGCFWRMRAESGTFTKHAQA
jgi:hypothetical protein